MTKRIMIFFLAAFFPFTFIAQTSFYSFEECLTKAKDEQKQILMIFTGSDWCKPCIQLKESIIETEKFESFANKNLILFLVDFPYKRKNQLPEIERAHNERIALEYNGEGSFPKAVILDEQGKKIAELFYAKQMKVGEFIDQIKNSINL